MLEEPVLGAGCGFQEMGNRRGIAVAPERFGCPASKVGIVVLEPGDELPLGLVLNQDVSNFERAHRGMYQPGFTHLTVSPTEECRLVNLHRNLEELLDLPRTPMNDLQTFGGEGTKEP